MSKEGRLAASDWCCALCPFSISFHKVNLSVNPVSAQSWKNIYSWLGSSSHRSDLSRTSSFLGAGPISLPLTPTRRDPLILKPSSFEIFKKYIFNCDVQLLLSLLIGLLLECSITSIMAKEPLISFWIIDWLSLLWQVINAVPSRESTNSVGQEEHGNLFKLIGIRPPAPDLSAE